MKARLLGKIATVWITLIGSFVLCWVFGNFWLAVGVFLMSLSNKAEEIKV